MAGSKVALVTGATSGIGQALAAGLAGRGFTVLLHGRTAGKAAAAAERLAERFAEGLAGTPAADRASVPEGIPGRRGFRVFVPVACDLSSLDEIRTFAESIRSDFGGIDVLVNNAGVFSLRRKVSADGYELQFAVNYLAGYLLTRLLLPVMAGRGGRVVMVSSGSHRSGRIHFRNLQLRGLYFGFTAYAQSKLANIMFARELQVRAAGRIDAFAFEPGLVNTDMGEKADGLTGLVWSRRRHHGVSPEEGASTGLTLATDPDLTGSGGTYWAAGKCVAPAGRALDDSACRKLWQVSARLCGTPEEPTLDGVGESG